MKKLLLLSVLSVSALNARAQLAAIDPTFNPGTGFDFNVSNLALQPDGKILAVGTFENYNGTAALHIVRINADGSFDNNFDPPGSAFGFGNLYAVAVQANGKILVSGDFTTFNGVARKYIVRLNNDGSLDESFDAGTTFSSGFGLMAIQADGKILTSPGKRLNADGSLDNSFTSAVGALGTFVLRADGKIQLGNKRLNADGSIDASFSSAVSTSLTCFGVQPDGKVVIGGNFSSIGGEPQNYLARLNADGSVDNTFPYFSELAFNYYPPQTITIQSNGKILVGGDHRLIRLNADGTTDASFQLQAGQSGVDGIVNKILVQPDGKIIASGGFYHYNDQNRNKIVRVKGGEPTAIAFLSDADLVQARPNPTRGQFLVTAKTVIQRIEVADVTGRVMLAQTVQGQSASLDLSRYATGLYVVKVYTVDGLLNAKVVKE